MKCCSSLRQFSYCHLLHKRSGKPTELPDYKQVYLPYDEEPSAIELENARKKFTVAYHGRCENRKLVEVKNVPRNVFTYGKEGMSVPISILKEQPDPVIGPEWTYPGIYENKIVTQPWHLEELFEREKNQTFESPWQKQVLNNQVKKRMAKVAWRMSMLNLKSVDVFQKERGATKRFGSEGGKEKGSK